MPDADAQDQAEVFDETHLDDDGEGELLLDEMEPVLDVTQAEGDADGPGGPEDDSDDPGLARRETLEAEADALLGEGETEGDDDGLPHGGPDEVELVYDGLMGDRKGAQASAAHWEAKRLADDDIAALGYGPDEAASQEKIA